MFSLYFFSQTQNNHESKKHNKLSTHLCKLIPWEVQVEALICCKSSKWHVGYSGNTYLIRSNQTHFYVTLIAKHQKILIADSLGMNP
jgi:hypothetical protein